MKTNAQVEKIAITHALLLLGVVPLVEIRRIFIKGEQTCVQKRYNNRYNDRPDNWIVYYYINICSTITKMTTYFTYPICTHARLTTLLSGWVCCIPTREFCCCLDCFWLGRRETSRYPPWMTLIILVRVASTAVGFSFSVNERNRAGSRYFRKFCGSDYSKRQRLNKGQWLRRRSPSQGYPQQYVVGTYLYTWVERDKMEQNLLSKETTHQRNDQPSLEPQTIVSGSGSLTSGNY